MPAPKVHLNGTNRASYCSVDDRWVIFAPKSVPQTAIDAQCKRLAIWRDAKQHHMRMSQAEAAGTLSAWEADGKIPKAATFSR